MHLEHFEAPRILKCWFKHITEKVYCALTVMDNNSVFRLMGLSPSGHYKLDPPLLLSPPSPPLSLTSKLNGHMTSKKFLEHSRVHGSLEYMEHSNKKTDTKIKDGTTAEYPPEQNNDGDD